MTRTKLTTIFASAVLALALGCTSNPIYNVQQAPIPSVTDKKLSMEDVSKAIIRAGTGLGWQMRQVKPGHIIGTLNLRRHTAVVDVTYDTKSYSIVYKDSSNLNYDGSNIHRNYNGWIQNLDRAIRSQLIAI